MALKHKTIKSGALLGLLGVLLAVAFSQVVLGIQWGPVRLSILLFTVLPLFALFGLKGRRSSEEQ